MDCIDELSIKLEHPKIMGNVEISFSSVMNIIYIRWKESKL